MRNRIAGIVLAVLPLSVLGAAAKAEYPDKPIEFVTPYPAGTAPDLVMRIVAPAMARTLGQPVVVDNRGGAGGNIGMSHVARSRPDGYVIGLGGISTNAIAPHIYKSVPFDAQKDFSAVAMLGASAGVIAVKSDSPIRNIADLVEYARQHPGMSYGTTAAGTSPHLAGIIFREAAGLDLNDVGYKSGAQAITDLVGGHIPLMINHMMPTLPLIKSGQIRAIAVFNKNRSPLIPDVPTVAEQGFPGFAVEPWFAVYGPAGMPRDVVDKLNAAIGSALADADVKARLIDSGFNPEAYTAGQLEEYTEQEFQRFGKVVRDGNITAD